MAQAQNFGLKEELYLKRYEEFPLGKWFVRWVGKHKPPSMNRQTPRMEVLLCQVPSWRDFDTYAPYIDTNPHLIIVELSVGELPDIRLNEGYEDGIHVYTAPSKLISARVNATVEQLQTSLTQISLFKDKSRQINGWFSAVQGTIGESPVKVFIPCWEILRALYTPTSHFAKSLLGYPGDVAINKIVDMTESTIDPDSPVDWRFKLRHLTPIEFHLTAGFLSLYPPARAALNNIYIHAISPAGFIGANLPFDDDQLDIKFKVRIPHKECMIDGVRHLYATELIYARWDVFDSLKFHADKEGGGKDGTAPSALAKPSPYGSGLSALPSDGEITISGADPDKNIGNNAFHRKRGISALVADDVSRIPVIRDAITKFSPKTSSLTDNSTSKISASDRGANENDVSGSSNDQDLHRKVDAFQLLIEAFGRLLNKGQINDFEIISPPQNESYRCEIPVWKFPVLRDVNKPGTRFTVAPERILFGWIDFHERRHRTLLVIKIGLTVEGTRQEVLWFETETKQGTGVRSVIATGAPLNSNRIIGIRDAIANRGGNLGVSKNLLLLGTENGSTWSWKHAFSSSPDPSEPKSMNEASMLKKIIEGLYIK